MVRFLQSALHLYLNILTATQTWQHLHMRAPMLPPLSVHLTVRTNVQWPRDWPKFQQKTV